MSADRRLLRKTVRDLLADIGDDFLDRCVDGVTLLTFDDRGAGRATRGSVTERDCITSISLLRDLRAQITGKATDPIAIKGDYGRSNPLRARSAKEWAAHLAEVMPAGGAALSGAYFVAMSEDDRDEDLRVIVGWWSCEGLEFAAKALIAERDRIKMFAADGSAAGRA